MRRSFILLLEVVVLLPAVILGQVTALDTVYTPVGYPDPPLAATIFIPAPSTARGIGVVLTHYYTGSRMSHRIWCDTLAARGYVAMTIDYPDMDRSDGLYPKPVRAFKTAVQFLKRNADRFGITTGQVVAWGQSQGSTEWGQTIIWDNDHDYFGTDPTIPDGVDAAVLLYGMYDMTASMPSWLNSVFSTYFSQDPSLRATKGQCIANVSNITTPVLMLQATNDPIVSVEQPRRLRDSLAFHGIYNHLIEFNSSASSDVFKHTFDMNESGQFTGVGLMAKDSVLAFLHEVLFFNSVERLLSDLPDDFTLGQNYPNPFNPSTTIRYGLPHRSHVMLTVFNTLGQEVAQLVNGDLEAGYHEVRFDASGLSSGVYFYRLQAGTFVETRKLLLLR
jgi:dienelactone hydrolase